MGALCGTSSCYGKEPGTRLACSPCNVIHSSPSGIEGSRWIEHCWLPAVRHISGYQLRHSQYSTPAGGWYTHYPRRIDTHTLGWRAYFRGNLVTWPLDQVWDHGACLLSSVIPQTARRNPIDASMTALHTLRRRVRFRRLNPPLPTAPGPASEASYTARAWYICTV